MGEKEREREKVCFIFKKLGSYLKNSFLNLTNNSLFSI